MDNYCGHSYIKCQHSKCWHFSVYTIKQSNGVNQQDVMTIDDNKKTVIKQIFWDMNSLTSEVKDEMVTEQGTNADEYVNWRQAGASRNPKCSVFI